MSNLIQNGVARKFICIGNDLGSNTSSIEVKQKDLENYNNFFNLNELYIVKFNGITGSIKLESRKKNPSLKWNTSIDKENKKIWEEFQKEYKKTYLDFSQYSEIEFSKLIIIIFEKIEDYIEIKIDTHKLEENKKKQITFNDNLITKENDFEKLKIEYSYFNEFIKGINKLSIPFYQRDYTWKDNMEVDDLLQDIKYTIECNENGNVYQHFMGNILLKNNQVVDGQQRLTTMLLIYIAMDKIVSGDNFIKNFITNKNELKIDNKYLNDAFLELIEREHTDLEILNYNYKKIKKTLIEFIGETGDANRIFEYGVQNLIFFIQELPDNMDENMVYETMNSRGKEITNYDLIKAYFLNFNISDEDFEKYETIIEGKNNLDSQVLDIEKITSFFRFYLAIRTGNLYSKSKTDTKGETLYKGFKKYIGKQYSAKIITEEIFLKEFNILKNYKKAFNNIQNNDFDYPIKNTYKWIATAYEEYVPILLEIEYKCVINKLDQDNKKEIVKHLVKYITYRMLSSNNKNSFVYPMLAHKLSSQELNYISFKNYLDDDDYIKKTLQFSVIKQNSNGTSYTSTTIPHQLLLLLERFKEFETTKEYIGKIEVEHIYPQSPTSEAGHTNFYNSDIYNQLGNFILLSSTKNGPASNKILKEKVQFYKSSSFIITQEFIEKYGEEKEFTQEKIEERTKKIISEIKSYLD